jgi:hypothetical protein
VALAVAPDGGTAYILLAPAPGRARLAPLALAGGPAPPTLDLPRPAVTLAVTPERVYVPDPVGHAVWAVDRRAGRLVQALPAGRVPMSIALGVAP